MMGEYDGEVQETETDELHHKRLDVYRHSWWKTREGERVFVVIRIYHSMDHNTIEPKSFDLLELAEQQESHVPVDVFRRQVERGNLLPVVRKQDVPRPPAIF